MRPGVAHGPVPSWLQPSSSMPKTMPYRITWLACATPSASRLAVARSYSIGFSGLGTVSSNVIDAQGIVPATKRAMILALESLQIAPDYLLIDYLTLSDVSLPQHGLPKGDALVMSIAAASILAKVYRDRLMVGLDAQYPGYGLARHKGYGTEQHRTALAELGPCPVHRMSFAPLRSLASGTCASWARNGRPS
jgi:ribonuclease HII